MIPSPISSHDQLAKNATSPCWFSCLLALDSVGLCSNYETAKASYSADALAAFVALSVHNVSEARSNAARSEICSDYLRNSAFGLFCGMNVSTVE